MEKVLVAGATGRLGQLVVAGLRANGYAVRALTRTPSRLAPAPGLEAVAGDLRRPDTLAGVCEGVDAVVSCAGAVMDLRSRERASFEAVDHLGNRHLLEEARRARVRKFVYVSLYASERLQQTEYARAHERFAAALRTSGLAATVVRPTGFFYFNAELFAMARQGRGVVVGPGTSRTNPIHEADAAGCCLDALTTDAPVIDAGGPDVFTRREVVQLAFDVLGRSPRLFTVPPAVMRGAAVLARPFNPRVAALLHFGTEVSLLDVVAPVRGARTLRAYFEALAAPAGVAA